jgi:nitroreductase
MNFIDVIKNRHSVRKFSSLHIEFQKRSYISDVMSRAPSAGDLKSYEVYDFDDKETKEKIALACSGQMFIANAPHILIFCSDLLKNLEKYGDRGRYLYATQDATIAAAYVQLAAIDIGLDTCWIGAFDTQKISEIIRVPLWRHTPVVVMPIGYKSEEV